MGSSTNRAATDRAEARTARLSIENPKTGTLSRIVSGKKSFYVRAMKTILVPIDFSDSTAPVLAKAVEIAGELSAKLVLLHVVEPVASYVPVGATMDVIAAVPPVSDDQETMANVGHRLSALAAPLRSTGLEVDEEVVVGLAVDDIVDQAKGSKADYIVLGSHGHGALYHLFGGSVVTGVLKRSPCPVIVIPAKLTK